MKNLIAILKDEKGATVIEYALIAVLISTAAIVAMGKIGASLSTPFNTINTNLSAAR